MATKSNKTSKKSASNKNQPKVVTFIRQLSRKTQISIAIIFVLIFGGIGTYLLTQSYAISNCTSNTYRDGSKGTCVKYLQQIQNGLSKAFAGDTRHGYTISSSQLDADGAFGTLTKNKVVRYQHFAGLSADGIVGVKTWTSMCTAIGTIHKLKLATGATINTAYNAAKNANCNKLAPQQF